MSSRISVKPDVCHGQACIEGTRIPVHLILRLIANGDSIETIIGSYPSLSRTDVLACVEYGASLAEEQFTPLGAF